MIPGRVGDMWEARRFVALSLNSCSVPRRASVLYEGMAVLGIPVRRGAKMRQHEMLRRLRPIATESTRCSWIDRNGVNLERNRKL